MFTEDHSKYYPVGSRRADFSQLSLFGSQLPITHRAPIDRAFSLMGTLRNYDVDGNGNVKKNNGISEQNSNSARASHFFVHFFAVSA